jgi:hypothetical protein
MTNEEAINMLKSKMDGNVDTSYEWVETIRLAIKALEQKDVLDKIRAEILDEAEYAYADFDRYKEDILCAEPDELPDDDFRYGLERAVEIINKYKSESEEEE